MERESSASEGVSGSTAPFVEPVVGPRLRVLFALLFLFLVGAAVALVATGTVSLDDVQAWVGAQGAWAPVVYLVVFVLAAVLVLPGTAIIVVAALLFPLVTALLLAWLGSVLGATAAFLVARRFGRGFVSRLLGARLARLDDHIAQRGFQVVLLLRLTGIPPYNLLNYTAGLTRVRPLDYVVATALGVLPLVVAVVTIVNRIGAAPSLVDVLTDPVLYAAFGLVAVLAIAAQRLRRRAAAVVHPAPPASGR